MLKSNCRSRNDFIEKTVRFYVVYLNNEGDAKFISHELEILLTSTIKLSEDRISKLMVKFAVEMSIMMNIIGANNDIDEHTLKRLRGKCIKDVKSTIGKISLEDVIRFQNE